MDKEVLLKEKEKIEGLLADYRKRLNFGDSHESNESFEEETDEAEEFATYLGVKDVLERRLKRIEKELGETP
jgi:RNA polymerase-binding transcription factor DksA